MPARSVSDLDKKNLALIRANILSFMQKCALIAGGAPAKLLDIAPQDHEGAKPFFSNNIQIETFDIDPTAGCTYVGDICKTNNLIPDEHFDYIVCTEVLEHVRQPFDAVREIWRLLKPGGLVFVSTPFNFRIHGPLPDCWRFTEHGLRELFSKFEIQSLEALECDDRFLMPIQYTLVAEKPKAPAPKCPL
jgi:SAM-dependent methyltransferase